MHSAAPAARARHPETRAGGPRRNHGPQPPPLPPAGPAAGPVDVDLAVLAARPPTVTRYDRSRRRPQRAQVRPAHRAPAPPRAARVWAGTSVLLAAAGVATLVFVPSGSAPARVDTPVSVAAAPAGPSVAASAAAVPSAPPAPAPLLLPASDPTRVRIPALGVTARMIRLGLDRDGAMEVPPDAARVGWYDRSPTPGQLGPAVLAGHVDWGGHRGAFYGLRELVPGDTVVVERADGRAATFAVDRVEEHAKDDFPTDEVYGDVDHAGLRLVTCGGSFDADTGDYRDNVIVFASLVSAG